MTTRMQTQMIERDFGLAVEQLCRYVGVRYYHSWSSKHSAPGWPDYAFVTADDRFLMRELKTERGKLTEAQRQWLKDLQRAGVNADVWRPSDLHSGRIQRELSPASQGAA